MIKINKLSKSFGKIQILKDISLNIKKGEIFGLLGENGAGKTTLLMVLSTLITPSNGDFFIKDFNNRKNPEKIRENIGVVFQELTLDEDLTVYQNLDIAARLYGLKKEERKERILFLVNLLDLGKECNKLVELLSGGMKKRAELARGLINNPEVLFLDEPTLSLDPKTRNNFWDYIKKINLKNKTTIILSTNYIEEAEKLCDRIAIIHEGKIAKIETTKQLKKEKKLNLYGVFLKYTK